MLRRPKATDTAIEMTTREGEFLGITLRQRQVEACIQQAIAPFGEHRAVDIGQPDFAGSAGVLAKALARSPVPPAMSSTFIPGGRLHAAP